MISAISYSQNLDTVNIYLQQSDLPRAKEAIDQYVSVNQNDVSGWLTRAEIYRTLSSDPVYKDLAPDGKMEAFNSIKNATSLNKEQVAFELKKTDYSLIRDLYKGFTTEGVAYFNAGTEKKSKHDYETALDLFKKASLIGSFSYTQHWGGTKIDTTNLYYAAKAAINAGKDEDAENFCRLIVDSGIVKNATHADFEPFYQWLVYHIRQQNKGEELAKYTALSDNKFPKASYYDLNYSDWLREQKKYSLILTLYQGLFKKGLSNPELRYTYMQDIFNYLYNSDTSTVEGKESWTIILDRELAIAVNFNPSNIRLKLLYAKFYLNQAVDLQKVMLANKEDKELVKKSKDMIASFIESSNKMLREILSLCNSSNDINAEIKKDTLNQLVNNYNSIGETQKAKKYRSQLAKLNKNSN